MYRFLLLTTLLLFAILPDTRANTPQQEKATKFDLTQLPQPFSEDYPHFTELYNKAWELAWTHITYRKGMPQTPFIDEALSPINDWIWDTQFMLLYWRYASHLGNWIKTNNNFYMPIHDNATTTGKIHIPDNPPLFAWSEYMYNKVSGDTERMKKLLLEDKYLQRHFVFFDTIQPGFVKWGCAPTCLQKVENGYLWEGGRSGMDNTPRGRTYAPVKEERPNNPNLLWVDAIAQQAMSADFISQMYAMLKDNKSAKVWSARRDSIGKIINSLYWDSEDAFYYDIDRTNNALMKVATPASYWVLLAGCAPKERAKEMAMKITDKNWFGAKVPLTTLLASDPNFAADGDYWRGSMWLPTAYMSLKALDRYGFYKESHDAAVRIIEHQYQTFKQYSPNTIWECYSPTEYKPSFRHDSQEYVTPNFCGWSALGPISLYIEDVLGFFDIDANERIIRWNRTLEKPHGIRNLRFGDITTDIIWDGQKVVTKSDKPYTLIVNGKKISVAPNK